MCIYIPEVTRKEEGEMALPIAATPTLSGKEATKFMATIHKDAQKLVSLTPTPKLARARDLIKKRAEHQQKRIH